VCAAPLVRFRAASTEAVVNRPSASLAVGQTFLSVLFVNLPLIFVENPSRANLANFGDVTPDQPK